MEDVIFNLEISYSQIAIFLKGLENPFNDWSDKHVDQGFSWRSESVSFGTLSGDGQCKVIVGKKNEINYDENAARVIIVPFRVKNNGIEIASIIESFEVDIPEGNYELIFSGFPQATEEGYDKYEIYFVKSDNPKARIVIADEELNPPKKLLMKANAAK